jgi:hypothetical protein
MFSGFSGAGAVVDDIQNKWSGQIGEIADFVLPHLHSASMSGSPAVQTSRVLPRQGALPEARRETCLSIQMKIVVLDLAAMRGP